MVAILECTMGLLSISNLLNHCHAKLKSLNILKKISLLFLS
ncbi:hypothetical protein HanXRQr2_Chr13g0577021 [Helianthus annuus]|uniref:Uncharacterized protein n=1 Tax=Helianthus annuus TaxID=4232 RepID=A0A9K3HBJ8_HELAN|nr:hypothetical protein HanXRQr2_Chr13g0577021 [Helianthus annuus]KAJ0848279.1 hypothetical protein HanPSC8_Chr13g0555261 [Helianthus annuus]